ncbi:hypothetical protein [Pedobacter sandarakinus]|uniref:hypothetical protein n=1 Tax=Pedobacter sandarakinus TaxID=353156 RepID=UPI00224601F8|nr:hypothetical protein [Pedobacter sandarakinus]MCX2575482.1 hypothetical protein [Pedobacter sandarakinus]
MLNLNHKQPWLNTAWSDLLFILAPAFLSLLLVFMFPAQFQHTIDIPLVYWVFLIVFIDVAHVYSTLYRTYFNISTLKQQRTLLLLIPVICYISGVFVYKFDALWFWRILAYLAVYHFVRQQYGFMRLYTRNEDSSKLIHFIDKTAIYVATLYPLLFWHLNSSRNFNWFIAGDFLNFQNEPLLQMAKWLYVAVILAYLTKEVISVYRQKWLNIPRNLLIFGTFLSWYFGIVYFNGDMAFTTLNVLSHGIPYMALIWFFEKKKYQSGKRNSKLMKLSFGRYGLIIFFIVLVALAYVEEGFWDGFIWQEHQAVFKPFANLPRISSQELLSLIIPLLALPQATHYVLDGFIWKAKNKF